MQCPKCQRENFEIDRPCPQCGFQFEANGLNGLSQQQMDEWGEIKVDTLPISKLKEIRASHRIDTQARLGLRPPPFTPEEAEKAWVELAQLEMLFEKVDEWRNAGYFTEEMGSLDPVKAQRAHADELRLRLTEYQRPKLPQTDRDRLKMVGFLMDNIDLFASRQWFKSRKEIEKVVGPIIVMMLDVISGNKPE